MAMVEILPAAPARVQGTKPLFIRPAGYVPYVPPSIPDAVPDAVPAITQEAVPSPQPIPDSQLGWWASWPRSRARNKLQRTLARVIQIAQDHESNAVKAGDPIYQHLYAKALELCQSHFSEWHLKRDDIEIEIPCMRQLRLMAKPEAVVTVRRAPVALLGLVAIVALPLVVGAWCGLFGVGHHWIMHLFGG
jgi:hypothetical protein